MVNKYVPGQRLAEAIKDDDEIDVKSRFHCISELPAKLILFALGHIIPEF